MDAIASSTLLDEVLDDSQLILGFTVTWLYH